MVRIVRSDDGEVRLLGDNSDWVGFTESLRPLLRPDIQRALCWAQVEHHERSLLRSES